MKDQRPDCPSCGHTGSIKSGIVRQRQRWRCKNCGYHFTVQKRGKSIADYYVVKALQLYLEGLSYREIERLLGVSHVTVMNWVKKYGVKQPGQHNYYPSYKILTRSELVAQLESDTALKEKGVVITPLGDKFMVIQWERFRQE